jgi:hypothetical protein
MLRVRPPVIELTGALEGIGLPAIVRLLGELRETGVLRLTSGSWVGELGFIEGRLSSATFGQAVGPDALDACVLMLGRGDFAFVEDAAVEPNIALGEDDLRLRLEAQTADQDESILAVPSLDAVPRVTPEAAPSTERVVLDRTAVQILLLVDGQRTVRDIISDRPLVPTLRDLGLLAHEGLIVVDPRAHTPPAGTSISSLPRERANGPLADLSTRAGGAQAVRAAQARSAADPQPVEPDAAIAHEDEVLGVCSKLGFADDSSRHYSRPTALHRCYATMPASLVSGQEQRDLCLGGGYLACPRFRAEGADATGMAPRVPPGVASRLAAARAISGTPPNRDDMPDWIGRDRAPVRPTLARAARLRALPRRGLLLIAGGAAVGIVLLVAGLLALPVIRPGLVQAPPTSAPAIALPATSVPVSTAAPPAVPTAVVKPTAAPTTPPRLPTPTVAQLAANTLLDARFAVGAPKEWLENEPFAGWRDGAYRLNARQPTRFVAIAAPVRVPDDVTISATLRKTGGPPGGGYGIIVRNQSVEALDGTNQTFDAYVAEAGDLGEFGVWRREGDRWVDLVPWTSSQAVRQGGSPNELIVRLAGGQILLTINGIEVARVDDNVLAHGGVGVFAGGDNNEVALDRFTVQVPN